MPVDTVGLRKISKSQGAALGANSSLHRVMAPPADEVAGQHSFSSGGGMVMPPDAPPGHLVHGVRAAQQLRPEA